MLARIIRCALLTIAFTLVLPAHGLDAPVTDPDTQQEAWRVDATHSMVLFRVRHHVGAFWGRFNDVNGTADLSIDGDALTGMALDISVPIAGVDCGNDNLDRHLRSSDFFNEVEFPAMTFKSTSAKHAPAKQHPDGDVFDVEGDLTMHGVTKRIKVEAVLVGHSIGKRGEKIGLECIFSVKRSEYGMSYGVASGSLGDETRIIVSLEATAQ